MVFEYKRTHKCNELSLKEEGKDVVLNGWVHTRRDHGGIIFIDLRDRYGFTQIVFDPKFNNNSHNNAQDLRREDVIAIKGKVAKRDHELINDKISTGDIEVYVSDINVIGKAKTPPFELDSRKEVGDDLRLKYRFIDLRRQEMQQNLKFRYDVIKSARNFFDKNDFYEIETPMLVKSTPEGARDYLVPSRVNLGKFYALPQSPQLYKQILMISGCDRYFQIARCLRDEDLRSDRQPEHTQMDFEMSFVDSQDIMKFVEGLYKHIFKETLGINIKTPFKVMSYQESFEKYATDKPDLRFDLELTDLTNTIKGCNFKVFNDVLENNGIIKCINPEMEFGRNEIDALINFAIKSGAKGMAWMKVTKNGLESNIAKFFSDDIQKAIIKKTNAKVGSILMFIADEEKKANRTLNALRNEIAQKKNLIKDNEYAFAWITDFPLFSFDKDTNSWTPEHHMFSMPNKETIKFLNTDPGKVIGDLFDLVLNGTEIGSGSIRIHDPKLQEKIMKIIGMSKKDAMTKFGFLLDAYEYGAPIHGGMGLGLDRSVALMKGLTDIREVIAFPKNKNAQCPMDDSPSDIEESQLKELHLELDF